MQHPIDHLVEIAKFSTGVDLENCSWSVGVTHREDSGYNLTIRVHHASPELILEARERFDAKASPWSQVSSGQIFRTWDFNPEGKMVVHFFESAPEGATFEDLVRAESAKL